MTILSTQAQTQALLQSPFQQRKSKRNNNNMVNSSSYISLSDSASSSSSFSDVDQQEECYRTSSEVSVDMEEHQQICFCGQSITKEDEDEVGIYCSIKCARQDAMAALTGAPCTPERSQIRSEPIISHHNHHHNPSSKKSIIKHSYNSSIALQKKTIISTHYRRMEALESRDEYPIEAVEEAFLTPSSGSTSLYNQCEHDEKVQGVVTSHVQPSFALQRWMKENGLQLNPEKTQMCETDEFARQSSEIDISHPLQKRTVSLPDSPSLESDDAETQDQRKRQAEIEQEIKNLDVELKQKLEQFDKDQAEISLDNTKPIGLFEEDDILMEFTSPKLDYEAPLGWRRGSKVYSSNFLGLQLSASDEEDLTSHGSNEALDHSSQHVSRIERLHEALGMAIIAEDVEREQSNEIKQQSLFPEIEQESSRIPSALDMAKDLAFMQATWNARQHVRQLSTTSIGEMPQRQTKMKKLTNQSSITNIRSLTNFFQRRPSQNHLETGISSNDQSNKIDRLTKSTSPRFASLKPTSAKQFV